MSDPTQAGAAEKKCSRCGDTFTEVPEGCRDPGCPLLRAEMDREATAFAMELLMPDFLLRPELETLGSFDIEDEKIMRALATKFRVSPQLMQFRVGQFLHEEGII